LCDVAVSHPPSPGVSLPYAAYADEFGSSWTSDPCMRPSLMRLLRQRLPHVQKHGFRPPWACAPYRVLTTSRPSDPAAGYAFLEFSAPFNGILDRAPCGAGCPNPPRLRSQAFSTSQRLTQQSSSTALFHAATVPGLPPFRAFPSQGSCTSLESTGFHAVVHELS